MELVHSFIEQELQLAQGCTEPAAVAYAVAAAAEKSRGELQQITIELDGYVYKNGMKAGIPGIDRHQGNIIAAALGYYTENPSRKGLEVLSGITKKSVAQAEGILDKISFTIVEEKSPYIRAILEADNKVTALIKENHGQLNRIEVDGSMVYQRSASQPVSQADENSKLSQLDRYLYGASLPDIFKKIETEFDSQALQFLKQGLAKNLALVEAARLGRASGIGNKFEKYAETEIEKIGGMIAQGIDARMSGVDLPALASSGSGNKGITISISLYRTGKYLGKKESDIFRATLLSHIVTHKLNLYLGKLSSLCGLFSAAAGGMLAGFLYLEELTDRLEEMINYLLGDSSGSHCDGAKSTCILKAVSSFELAYRYFRLARTGLTIDRPVGIIAEDLAATLKNLADLSLPSERTINQTLIEVISRTQSAGGEA